MQHPITSRLAHNKVKADGKDRTHQNIIYDTLKALSNEMGTASDIAIRCKLDYIEVNRRLSELVADNRIYIFSETGGKSPSKRACRIYKVVTGEKQVEQQGDLFNAA